MLRTILALVLAASMVVFAPLVGFAEKPGMGPAVEFILSQRQRLAVLASVMENRGVPVGIDLEPVMKALETAEERAMEEPEEAIAAALEALNATGERLTMVLTEDASLTGRSETRALERAIDVKREHLERLRSMVASLEDLNATLSSDVYENLAEIEALINESQSLLIEGDVGGAAEALARASKLIGQTVSILAREARDEFSWASASLAIARGLEEAALRLAETLEAVEEAIRENNIARAEAVLERTIRGIDRLNERLEKIIDVVRDAGVHESAIERLESMSITLGNVRDTLELALEALRSGDVITAMQLVEDARQELERTAGLLDRPGVPEKAREIIMRVKEAARERRGIALENVLEIRSPEGLRGSAEATLRFLDNLKERYLAGKISEETYKRILGEIEETYLSLIEKVEARPMPEMAKKRLLDRLNQVIQWIEENKP